MKGSRGFGLGRSVKVCLACGALAASACAAETYEVDELDPARELDWAWDEESGVDDVAERPLSSDEWYDEEGIDLGDDVEVLEDGEVGSTSAALRGVVFQLPFRCGQVWAGQTRTNHSPLASIDFNRGGDFGDAVVASAGGRVSVVGNTGGSSYGRWIEIDHGAGLRTRYAHLSAQAVRVGQHVARGQRIGRVGNSGGSTGPHLHFELRRDGVAIRPTFNGSRTFFYGTRNYRSRNGCASAPDGANGTVRTSGLPLTIRSGPGVGHRAVGTVANGARVRIRCHARGSRVNGTYGTTRLWDRIGRGWVSDAYVHTGTDGRVARWCR